MIQFQAKYLAPLMAFKSNGNHRHYLNAMHIRPHKDGGALLVATDGAKMLLIRDTQAKCAEPAIIKLSDECKKYAKKSKFVDVNTITERLILSDKRGEETFVQPGKCILDATYPDIDKVMPDFKTLTSTLDNSKDAINSKFITSALSIVENKQVSEIRFWQDVKNYLVVQYLDHPEYCAIIMPMRARQSLSMDEWGGNFLDVSPA